MLLVSLERGTRERLEGGLGNEEERPSKQDTSEWDFIGDDGMIWVGLISIKQVVRDG